MRKLFVSGDFAENLLEPFKIFYCISVAVKIKMPIQVKQFFYCVCLSHIHLNDAFSYIIVWQRSFSKSKFVFGRRCFVRLHLHGYIQVPLSGNRCMIMQLWNGKKTVNERTRFVRNVDSKK